MRDGGCCTDKKAVYCHNEGEERGGWTDAWNVSSPPLTAV